jgi:hypothetical protein
MWPTGTARTITTIRMARPEGFEPPTYGFEARRSIQLSYGRMPTPVLTYSEAVFAT